MVQSEVEVIKLEGLIQKVIFKWLDSSARFPYFGVEVDKGNLRMCINSSTVEVVSYTGSNLPRCSISITKVEDCPYGMWIAGLADYGLSTDFSFYGRGKLLGEFKRNNLGSQDTRWYPYILEILSQLNESQRFALEMLLRDTLKQLDKEVEFRKRISHGS